MYKSLAVQTRKNSDTSRPDLNFVLKQASELAGAHFISRWRNFPNGNFSSAATMLESKSDDELKGV
jgi:hypothetical protein